ncbi:MAG: HAD hydrolase-like protein, partial [Candidatus Heimdallarchaeota archaeon]|nr:HAD hydrolase-like protein [Candidatus Heimdallarchaeota archaeon]
AQIFGKPYKFGYQLILDSYEISAKNAVMIGDRLSTDIVGANRMGITSICIETGVHTRKDACNFSPEFLPTAFYSNLREFRKHV